MSDPISRDYPIDVRLDFPALLSRPFELKEMKVSFSDTLFHLAGEGFGALGLVKKNPDHALQWVAKIGLTFFANLSLAYMNHELGHGFAGPKTKDPDWLHVQSQTAGGLELSALWQQRIADGRSMPGFASSLMYVMLHYDGLLQRMAGFVIDGCASPFSCRGNPDNPLFDPFELDKERAAEFEGENPEDAGAFVPWERIDVYSSLDPFALALGTLWQIGDPTWWWHLFQVGEGVGLPAPELWPETQYFESPLGQRFSVRTRMTSGEQNFILGLAYTYNKLGTDQIEGEVGMRNLRLGPLVGEVLARGQVSDEGDVVGYLEAQALVSLTEGFAIRMGLGFKSSTGYLFGTDLEEGWRFITGTSFVLK